MVSNATCGQCGSPLDHPSMPCRACGTRPRWAAPARPRKSPLKAAALAIVPGLGHLYLGDWRRALAFVGAFGVLEFLGLDLDLTAIGAVVGVPMELGGFGLWMFSIFDAYRTARRPPQGPSAGAPVPRS